MDYDISRILHFQKENYKEYSWEEVEKRIGIVFPEDFLFEFYYGQNGLFPWGITDNGDELFWNYKDDTIEIIVYSSRYTEYVTYAMCMEKFLCNLLKKDIICSIFPDDFVLDSNYYVTI